MPLVPTKPEPLDALRKRYPACLEYVYDTVQIRDCSAIRPGEIAANVFDFEDGLKLIVSRERMPDGKVVLHFSASFPSECRIADEFRLLVPYQGVDRVMSKWLANIPARFAELSGDNRPATFVGVSEGNIPHWVIE